MRLFTTITVLALTVAPVAFAQDAPEPTPAHERSPDALALLQAARAAMQDGFAAEVRTYLGDNTNFASLFPKGEGVWMHHPGGEDGEWSARYSGNGTVMGKPEPIGFDVVWRPDRVVWVDHAEGSYNVQPPRARKRGEGYMLAESAWTQSQGMVDGFTKQLEAHRLAVEPSADVDGVRCDVVSIMPEPDAEPAYWYFGVEDSLPRRTEMRLPEASGGGALRVDFTDVRAGADTVSEADWVLEAPSGYTENISRALSASPAGRPAQQRDAGAPAGPTMPDWEVADSEGSMVSPGSLRGEVSVLYFWGTWSPLCRKATPELVELARDYEDKPVRFVSLAFREGSPDAVLEAARDSGQTWTQVPAADDVVRQLKIRVAPSVVVLGPESRILFQSGRPEGDDFDAMFDEVRAIIDRALAGDLPAPEAGEGPEPRGPGASGPGLEATPEGTRRVDPRRFRDLPRKGEDGDGDG